MYHRKEESAERSGAHRNVWVGDVRDTDDPPVLDVRPLEYWRSHALEFGETLLFWGRRAPPEETLHQRESSKMKLLNWILDANIWKLNVNGLISNGKQVRAKTCSGWARQCTGCGGHRVDARNRRQWSLAAYRSRALMTSMRPASQSRSEELRDADLVPQGLPGGMDRASDVFD